MSQKKDNKTVYWCNKGMYPIFDFALFILVFSAEDLYFGNDSYGYTTNEAK